MARRKRKNGSGPKPPGERQPLPEGEDFWVFAYGSLMWQPGFAYLEARPALLRGYHRSFCIYSHYYRGTPSQPGLVLGLNGGGSCRGIAFRVTADQERAVRDYLDERELVSYAYRPRFLRVELPGGAVVRAYSFVADRHHHQYAGEPDIERAAAMIMMAAGCAGLNRDYLINTVRHLEKEGFVDRRLHCLLQRVTHLTGIIEAGGGI